MTIEPAATVTIKGSLKKVLQIPVVCVLFLAVGMLSLLLLVWMAAVSVGLLVRKSVLSSLDRLRERKTPRG